MTPTFGDLVASMMRSTAADRVNGSVHVRTVESIDPDRLLPDDVTVTIPVYGPMLVTEFDYRVMRLDDKVRCESFDGYVHFLAGRYQVWTPDPSSGRVRTEARTEAWFHTPDDYGFGVDRPRPDRWEGDDFTRPIGEPGATTFLGRPAWQIDLAPPPHKPYELTLVVDAATGLVLRQSNAGFGSYSEWTELDTAAELSEDLFVWDDARDRPVPPAAEVERPVLEEDVEAQTQRLEFLDAMVAATDRRDEVVSIVGDAPDAETAVRAIAALLGTSEAGARGVLDLQVRRFAGFERDRLVAQRDDVRAWLRQR